MSLFDTHAHLDAFGDDAALDGVVRRAVEAGVERILAVGASRAANIAAIAAARRFPSQVFAAVGFDRDNAGTTGGNAAEELVDELETCIAGARTDGTRIVAVGEIGIDLHYAPETRKQQIELFDAQLHLARLLGLPVIVHCREAFDVVLPMLEAHAAEWKGRGKGLGVIHCFTGDTKDAMSAVEMGYFVSFSGIVTYSNAKRLAETARLVPGDRLLIETDTPFLTPEPFRGRKPNEPALVAHVAAKLAELRGCSTGEIADLTTRNGERLFGIA